MKHEIYINDGMYVLISSGKLRKVADNLDDLVTQMKEDAKFNRIRMMQAKNSTSETPQPKEKPGHSSSLGALFDL